jgi:two-component system phosphate regulon sensor histidine kinase PhoR
MIRFATAVARGDYARGLPAAGADELSDMERTLVALRDQIRDQVERLARDGRTLSTLLERLPNAVLVLDATGKVLFANGAARTLLRFTDNEAIGLPAAEVLRHPQILQAIDALASGTQEPEPFALSWPDPPGRFEVAVRPLASEGEAAATLVVLRDITREAHLERVRTDFISNLSHELRTPLTAIRGAAETLLEAALSDPEAARKFLQAIRRNAVRLESLLRDVSDLSRAESGLLVPDLRDFDECAVVEQVTELFRGEAEKAEVALGVQCADAPHRTRSDPELLESILVNLVQNAVRYTPAGGRVEVRVLEARPRGVVFEVADTGIGIPPRDLPRVTERFYRADPGRSRAVGGTGLGLSIVKHLVEVLGGQLEIRSEPGKGTTVRVLLPSPPDA